MKIHRSIIFTALISASFSVFSMEKSIAISASSAPKRTLEDFNFNDQPEDVKLREIALLIDALFQEENVKLNLESPSAWKKFYARVSQLRRINKELKHFITTLLNPKAQTDLLLRDEFSPVGECFNSLFNSTELTSIQKDFLSFSSIGPVPDVNQIPFATTLDQITKALTSDYAKGSVPFSLLNAAQKAYEERLKEVSKAAIALYKKALRAENLTIAAYAAQSAPDFLTFHEMKYITDFIFPYVKIITNTAALNLNIVFAFLNIQFNKTDDSENKLVKLNKLLDIKKELFKDFWNYFNYCLSLLEYTPQSTINSIFEKDPTINDADKSLIMLLLTRTSDDDLSNIILKNLQTNCSTQYIKIALAILILKDHYKTSQNVLAWAKLSDDDRCDLAEFCMQHDKFKAAFMLLPVTKFTDKHSRLHKIHDDLLYMALFRTDWEITFQGNPEEFRNSQHWPRLFDHLRSGDTEKIKKYLLEHPDHKFGYEDNRPMLRTLFLHYFNRNDQVNLAYVFEAISITSEEIEILRSNTNITQEHFLNDVVSLLPNRQ